MRLETWAGFLFLNFDHDAEPLAAWLGDLPEVLASYRLEDMVTTRRVEYDLACNWKIYVENAMGNPITSRPCTSRPSRNRNAITTRRFQRMVNTARLFTRHTGSRALLPGAKGFPDIPTLEGLAAAGTYYVLINPSTMFGLTYDCMWWLELHPVSAGRSKLIVGSCFPKETVARGDFDDLVENYYERWNISIIEDNEISGYPADRHHLALRQARPLLVYGTPRPHHRQLGPRSGAWVSAWV